MNIKRLFGRGQKESRDITLKVNYNPYAEGSCLVKYGNTHIICTASIEENVPPFLRGKGKGWISAEYAMIPRSTHTRMRRDNFVRQPNGRTMEIQRLIARSLRAAIDLGKLGELQIIIDCDVLQADGGTRTAAITGGYVALSLAIENLVQTRRIKVNPIINHVAAISCGVLHNNVIVDLDYNEDSQAEVDANFVMTEDGRIVELQSTAEKTPFTAEEFNQMLDYSAETIKKLITLQKQAIEAHLKQKKAIA